MDPEDYENVSFIPKLSIPIFTLEKPSYPGLLVLKLGRESFGIKVTFSESLGSIEYCYVFSFFGPLGSKP